MSARARYRCFDLVFDSPIELPLPPATDDPDVTVETGVVEEAVVSSPVDDTRGGIRVPDVATLAVHRGRRLVVDPAEGVSAAALAGPILGVGIAALCHQRDRPLLHGSAVLIDDTAVVLVGPSGAGKSTVATHLAAAGGTVLADDVVPIRTDAPELIAGPPLVRTPPSTIESMSLTPVETWPLATGDEAIHRLGRDRCGDVFSIDAVVDLGLDGNVPDGDTGGRSPAEAALTLLDASYTTHLDARTPTVERTVDRLASLAESAPVVPVEAGNTGRSPAETAASVRSLLHRKQWRER